MDIDQDLYDHLRALARRIHAERAGSDAAIQPTTLVHEVWLKLRRSGSRWSDRRHFLAVAARAMRQLLVDSARIRHALKRGGSDLRRITISDLSVHAPSLDMLDLDRALAKLEELDPVAAEIATIRTLTGATVSETAEVVDRPLRSVERHWRFAKAFLQRELKGAQ